MATFNVTVSEVTSAAAKIQQAAEDFKHVAGQVLAAAQSLGASWEGDSQVAFSQEQEAANGWYNQMVGIIDTYVAALNDAARKYAEADEQARAAITAK